MLKRIRLIEMEIIYIYIYIGRNLGILEISPRSIIIYFAIVWDHLKYYLKYYFWFCLKVDLNV